MKKYKNYIFFDEMVSEYFNNHGQNAKTVLVNDLKRKLINLSKTSQIIIITNQDAFKVTNWFIRNDLYQFTHTITNAMV